jgi:hypothetical protein
MNAVKAGNLEYEMSVLLYQWAGFWFNGVAQSAACLLFGWLSGA